MQTNFWYTTAILKLERLPIHKGLVDIAGMTSQLLVTHNMVQR